MVVLPLAGFLSLSLVTRYFLQFLVLFLAAGATSFTREYNRYKIWTQHVLVIFGLPASHNDP